VLCYRCAMLCYAMPYACYVFIISVPVCAVAIDDDARVDDDSYTAGSAGTTHGTTPACVYAWTPRCPVACPSPTSSTLGLEHLLSRPFVDSLSQRCPPQSMLSQHCAKHDVISKGLKEPKVASCPSVVPSYTGDFAGCPCSSPTLVPAAAPRLSLQLSQYKSRRVEGVVHSVIQSSK
jgi:hypothetical protein